MTTIETTNEPRILASLPTINANRQADILTVASMFSAIRGAEFNTFAAAALLFRTAESKTKGKGEVHDLLRSCGYSLGTAGNYASKVQAIASDEFWPKGVAVDQTKTLTDNASVFGPLLREFWGSVNDVTAKGPRKEREPKAPKAEGQEGDKTDAAVPAPSTGDAVLNSLKAGIGGFSMAEIEAMQAVLTAEVAKRAADDAARAFVTADATDTATGEGMPERIAA